MPVNFPLMPAQSNSTSLEAEIDAYLSARPAEGEGLIGLLGDLNILSPATEKVLSGLTKSANDRIALLSLLVLLRKGADKDEYFPLLISRLNSTQPDRYPNLGDIGFIFTQDAQQADINGLEHLAKSDNMVVQHAAFRALRKLAVPDTTGFLVGELDTADTNSQYLALITLAEINYMTGDYGPSMPEFEQNREKYIRLWKTWYEEQRN